MKSISFKTTIFVALLFMALLGAARFAMQTILTKHDAATVAAIDVEVANQKALLIATAAQTRQNSGTDAINAVVVDCKVGDRNRFDSLLDALSKNISQNELTELDSLFYKCADFYSLRKSLMSVELNREVARYIELKKMRSHIQAYGVDTSAEFTAWQKIAESEAKWAEYFSNLVTEQGAIITLFRNGKNATSPEVVTILERVKDSRAQMEVLGKEIEQFRTSIASI